MGIICVNRSGKEFPVLQSRPFDSPVLGTLRPNEVFTWLYDFSGNSEEIGLQYHCIYFRGSDGHFHEGWVNTVGAGSAITSITNCSLYDVDMGDGSGTVSVFQSRFAVDFYTPSGSYVNTIPAGYFISTKDGLAGESHKTWMHIHSYGESGPKFVDGFINIGFTSMMFESFPLIGTLK